MYFLIGAVVVALACSLITIRTLVGYSDVKFYKKILIGLFILYGWFSPFIVGAVRKFNLLSGSDYDIFSRTSYFLFGLMFILFSLLIVRDALWYLLYGFVRLIDKANWTFNPKNISVLDKANLFIFVFALLVSFYALHEGTKAPNIVDVSIESSKISKDVSLVQLTDLHITRSISVESIQNLVKRVNALKPDIIVITGDVIDDKVDALEPQMAALKKLKSKHGVYVSFGNHELYNGIASWQKKFNEMGFTLLFNHGLEIPGTNIYLAGIPDSHTARMSTFLNVNFYKALKGSNRAQYKILLSHTPDFVDYLSHEIINLQLSGHTHGGQIFPFHLLVKKANNYLAGLYDVRGLKLYVSRGVGYWGPAMRLFAPSEITLITLHPKKS